MERTYDTLVEAVLDHGEKRPDLPAVLWKNERLSYAELSRNIRAAARRLQRDYGVRHGDFVMISAVSKPDYVCALLAIQFLGAVVLPADKAAKSAALRSLCEDFRPRLLLSDAVKDLGGTPVVSLKGLCRGLSEEGCSPVYEKAAPEEIAEILFTTGTTGKPKGAMLSYGSLRASMCNTCRGIGMLESDTVLIPLPLNHSFGMRVLRSTLFSGAAVVLQNGFTFTKELEDNIARFGCTGLVSVPATMQQLYRQLGDRFPTVMGSLRYIEIGAGSLSADLRKKLPALLPSTEIHNTWGSTETGGALFLNLSSRPDKAASIGRPLPGIELKVLGGEGRSAETAGRMTLRGSMQMSGYYGMPELTAETIQNGWLLTNDMVYTDEDGYVYMLGRADDIINVGGEKVSPIEVENTAQEFDGVRECACIGVADPEGIMGQVPVLFVVPEGQTFTESGLSAFLLSRLERWKLPRHYVLLSELPRNRMQKVDRRALKARWEMRGREPLMNETIRSLLERRSIRDFTEEPIEKEQLELILQTGIHAPSGHNMQTWRFTVLQNPVEIARLKAAVSRGADRDKTVHFYGFQQPSAVILVSNDRRNKNAAQDSSCAAENMMLAAHSLGIGSVWVNALYFLSDDEEVRALLTEYGIPSRHIVYATLALGHPREAGKLLAKKQNVIRWIE